MTGALPESPPPERVLALLDLAAELVTARDALTTARDALASSPTRSAVLSAFAEALDGEARGLGEVLSGVYRLVELAEDTWDDLDGPDPIPGTDRKALRASLDRAVDNALTDLSRLTGCAGSTRAGAGAIDTRAVVTGWTGASPDEVYETVEHMPVADRRMLALAEPEATGGTYGVPWAMRSRANAVSVRRALHREQLAGTPWSPRIGRLETMVRREIPRENFRQNHRRIRSDGRSDGRRRRSFVAFSARRGGRMIEVVGDIGPGTEAVAVYVPGTGTNLDMSHVNTDVALDLVRVGGDRLAVAVFLDGEFPQDIMTDAGRPWFAQEMAPRLVRFCREVDRTIEIECPGAALTVVGHSYGGRIVGTAERLGLRADRVIYAESPDLGVGVASSSDWRSPGPVRRFSLTAPGDPVELLQLRSGLRRRWSTSDLGDAAVRLDTGVFADGSPVYGTRGHGGVFDAGCGAFEAMFTVMLGGTATLWRDREIRARHTTARRGTDGLVFPTLWRHAMGLWFRRDDDPYGAARIVWEGQERVTSIPSSVRAGEDEVVHTTPHD